jgi:hypothetical protein
VVLPAPGGASSTRLTASRRWRKISGMAESTGSCTQFDGGTEGGRKAQVASCAGAPKRQEGRIGRGAVAKGGCSEMGLGSFGILTGLGRMRAERVRAAAMKRGRRPCVPAFRRGVDRPSERAPWAFDHSTLLSDHIYLFTNTMLVRRAYVIRVSCG